MALIKTGAIVTEIRGKLDGLVYSRNRGGSYVKNFSNPINPNTVKQQLVRAIFGAFVNQWTVSLTNANRLSWNTYAANVPVKNKLGDDIYLSGLNMYLRTAVACVQNFGVYPPATAPTTFTLGEQDSTLAVSISAATQDYTVTFDDTKSWCDLDDCGLILSASSGQNSSRYFFDGPFKRVGAIEGSSTTAPTSTEDITNNDFTYVENQKVFLEARILEGDGRLSGKFRCSCVVGA